MEAEIMSISFYAQDQNWMTSQQNWSTQLSGSNSVLSAMASALSNKSAGIASIYNQEALSRVTKQLQSAATAAVQSESGGSSASSSSTSAAFSPSSTSAGYGPSTPSSGILTSYAPALQSSGTAATLLSSALSGPSNSVGSMLSNLITGGAVNILA
jgi:hypothetical protein